MLVLKIIASVLIVLLAVLLVIASLVIEGRD